MMKTIIIFTDHIAIYKFQGGHVISWKPINELPKSWIVPNGKLIVAYDQERAVDRDDFKLIVDEIENGSDVYILHHNHPNQDKLKKLEGLIIEKNAFVKREILKHTYDDEYKKIQDIDKYEKGIDGIDLQEIFEWYLMRFSGENKLEVALEFLHKCLPAAPKNEDFDELKKAGFELKEKQIEELMNYNNFDSDYVKTLSSVRDYLLSQAK